MSALHAEWTKLRTVPRWTVAMLLAALLTVGVSILGASGGATDINAHPNFVTGPANTPVSDEFSFAHQQVTGDVTVTLHVTSLGASTGRQAGGDGGPRGSHPLATTPWTDRAAGITLKNGLQPGSSYVSVLLTAEHGVRMQSDFVHDVAGSDSTGARWLRLTRTGTAVVGYESADGVTWHEIATMTPASVPATAEVGFSVSSAPTLMLARMAGGSSLGAVPTSSVATFESVEVEPAPATEWVGTRVAMPVQQEPDQPRKQNATPDRVQVLTEESGVYTLVGAGRVGPQVPDDDMVEGALLGIIGGLMALVAVGVLFATSEYRKGMIRTTFAATPSHGRVLAAKALVLGGTTFVLSLLALVVTFLTAVPLMKKHGFAPPAFPTPSIADPGVIRVLLLSALFVAGVAVFAFAVGMIVRHSAAAITLTIVLLILPVILGTVLPGSSPRWLMQTTLAGGFATLRVKPPTETLAEPWAMIGPWAGIGVVLVYAAGALGLAWWQLRRRDA